MDIFMQLPQNWQSFLSNKIDFNSFYKQLNTLIKQSDFIMPYPELIFNVFTLLKPEKVRCVLFGEDPYPRLASANGIAFWDTEIKSWQQKTNGNSLKNILKALLVEKKLANYSTPISECRRIAFKQNIASPANLFKLWLSQGVLLVNTSLTFAGPENKKEHFVFWQPFHKTLIEMLNTRNQSPYYILWGKKAQDWESNILDSIDEPSKIIKQGHPTFIHHFLDKNNPAYSPFAELRRKTGINWM